ncbi:hypothetical protein LTR09_002115 [Extremus antarcticus]|uniref:Uncharacterized protein n=1 Tax=Extremus antarcticus TaxID=702011 RepID=A0AAJ0LVU9_9PEZI|nr:hypothetical protein LTR09_002115 [Extremus antarcticus]
MPPILHAKQGSYSSNGSDLRVREIVLKKGQNGLTKPGTSSSAAPIVGNDRSQTGSKPSSQPLDRSVARSDLDSQWQLPQLPFTEREHGTSVSRPSGMPAPLFTERDHTRTLSAETTSNRPIGTPPRHPRQPSKDVPTGVAQSWTTAKLEGEPRILPSKRQESSPLAIQRTEQSRAADRSRVPSPEQQRGDETQAQTLDKKVYEASANAQKPHIQNQPQTQGPSSVPSQGIASAVQEKPLERNVETSATTKPVKPNLDKPMPSLPTTSGGIRDHYREVQEAEDSGVSKRPKLAPSAPSQESTKSSTTRGHDSGRASPAPAAKQTSVLPAAQSPSAGSTTTVRPVKETRVPTTTSDASRRSEEPAKAHGHKKADLEMRPPTSSLQPLKKTTKRDVRSPTPDAGSRPQSPPAIDRPPSAMDKALPTSFSEGNSHSRSATPDLARTSAKTPDPAAAEADPIATLQSLSKQVDALHARYTQLRTDRLRLSTAISSNLKDQKPGPGYANTLLDQHLSINAINSSMDIIFAKLRSLDCRKEDAIALLVAQTKSKSIAEDNVTEDTRSVASWQSSVTANLTTPSGRSTPDVEPKTLSPRFYNPSKLSPSIASTMSSAAPTPDLRNSPSTLQKLEKKDGQPTAETEKRVTVIRDSPEDDGEAMPVTATKALPPPPMSTKSIISSIEEEKNKIKRIRIKGAKAAKLLGLVAESRPGRPGSPEITLPDGSSLVKADRRDQLDIEVEISSKYSAARTKPASEGPVPAAMATVPKRKPVTSPRQGTNDSVSSVGTSSVNESAPDEPEVNTPRNSEDAPFGLKSAKRGMLQTIQVFVDDDILDYYKSTER